jgi:hypothetical protein
MEKAETEDRRRGKALKSYVFKNLREESRNSLLAMKRMISQEQVTLACLCSHTEKMVLF